jgi:hypothetical protein
MAGSVNEVKLVVLAVQRRVGDSYRLAFYGDAPFPLNVHVVENLILKITVVNELRLLDKPVRQRRFAVVNMRDYAKITYEFSFSHKDIIR